MAHKKYIKRGDKVFGPYLYENYREDGKVKTRYLGIEKNERKKGKFVWIIIGILILIILVIFLFQSEVGEDLREELFTEKPDFGDLFSIGIFKDFLNVFVEVSGDGNGNGNGGGGGSGGNGGGGGGGTVTTCEEDWICEEWSQCTLDFGNLDEESKLIVERNCENLGYNSSVCGYQTRECVDNNDCRTYLKKPEIIRECYYTENPNCEDGIKNCHDGSCEIEVDCGGPCSPCSSCEDGIKNNGEEDVDCGGPCSPCVEKPFSAGLFKAGFWIFISLLIIILIIFLNKITKYYLNKRREKNLREMREKVRKLWSKKGQARIVTVILLILIVLVGIGIVWNIVVGLVGEKSEDIKRETELFAVNLEIKEVVLYVTGSSEIRVRRGSGGGEIDKLRFVFYDREGKSAVRDKDENEDLVDILETKTYSFRPIDEIGKIERVSVYPVYKNKLGREFSSDTRGVLEVPESLVSWYLFDDEKDFVGKNHGEIEGASFDSGELVLNGNGYFKVADDDSLDLVDGLTISAWINPNEFGEIISKGGNYELSLNSENKVVFSFIKDGNLVSYESPESVDAGWNYVAVSADWGGIYKIFVNENLVGSGNLMQGVDVNNNELRIGQGFKGRIDDVMIFNEALSGPQIKAIYSYQKG